jgi:uncharacterized protein (TIGR02266 family)
MEPPRVGTQVSLRIYLPGMAQAIEFAGIIREVEAGPEHGFWAEFVSGAPGAKEKLQGMLFPQRTELELPAGPVPIGAIHPAKAAAVADEHAVVPSSRQVRTTPLLPTHVSRLAHAPPAAGAQAQSAEELADASNRRTFPRFRARFGVRFASVQDFVLEYAANISAGGVFVVTDFPPAMNAVITVSMELPGAAEPVTCKAVVVHRVTKEQGQERGVPAGAGVQFIDADDAFRETIDRCIEHVLAESG